MDDGSRVPEGRAKVGISAVGAFAAAFIGLAEALPALAPEVKGIPLFLGLVVGSAAVAVVGGLIAYRRFAVAAGAALVVAVLVGGWAVSGSLTDDGDERADGGGGASTPVDSTSTTSSSSTTTSTPLSPCPALPTTGSIQTTRGEGQTHVSEVTYALDDSKDPYIEIAGRLVGEVEPDYGLHLVKSGDPAAVFPRDRVALGEGGCWLASRWRMGWPCVGPAVARFYFMLIPAATADSLLAERESHPDGLPSERVLGDPAIVNLGYIDVAIGRHPDCPG